ncbi:SIMPL domain-containing protein [Rariglobus hedericola]|nr:SIMPL domain-containing protein [Rariglobus hedericola]
MTTSRPHLFGLLAGLALSAGLCFASITFTRAWTRISEDQVINVTGSARKEVRSDLAIWRASFTSDADTLTEAHQRSKADLAQVEAFLKAADQSDYVLKPVQVTELFTRTKTEEGEVSRRAGYRIRQNLEVRSGDVDALPKLASDAARLMENGVTLASEGMDFIYTKAGEAKIEMMGEAAKDARTRAEQIATQGGRVLKELRNARMGVVQINPLYSTATSWEGNNDTSSLEKTITTTVTATFSLR